MYQENSINTRDTTPSQTPSTEEVRLQLRRMLQCKYFRHSPRLSRFFSFTVEQALAGCEQRLKEYAIALEVFGKPDTFDPRMDSAVRVAARQLRAKIDLYYLTEGLHDSVLVRYRPGDYIPKFYFRPDVSARAVAEPAETAECQLRQVLLVEKDRSSIRALTDALDSLSHPIAAVIDSGEKCLELLEAVGPCVVITGLTLMGSMDGAALIRALKDRTDTAVLTLIPAQIEQELLDEVMLADPDALIFQPVRPADLKTAMRVAVARRNASNRARGEHTNAVLAWA